MFPAFNGRQTRHRGLLRSGEPPVGLCKMKKNSVSFLKTLTEDDLMGCTSSDKSLIKLAVLLQCREGRGGVAPIYQIMSISRRHPVRFVEFS